MALVVDVMGSTMLRRNRLFSASAGKLGWGRSGAVRLAGLEVVEVTSNKSLDDLRARTMCLPSQGPNDPAPAPCPLPPANPAPLAPAPLAAWGPPDCQCTPPCHSL